jgi:aminocarboxymuconate-semialdehyde decarboxylase
MVIDVHTHFIPHFVVDEAASEGCFGVREEDGWFVHPEGFRYPVDPEFLDMNVKLGRMDGRGIDVSVLSIAPSLFFYERPPEETIAFARRANDALVELVRENDRLEGLATVPLQAGDEAAVELERAVSLGLRGAQIGPSFDAGRVPIDQGGLEALFQTASRLEAPLMLHPYYVGPKPGLEDFYFTNSIGNPLETMIAAGRLIHSGVLDRHPGLKVILVHAGGFLPYQLGRLDHAYAVRKEPHAAGCAQPSNYLDRFWMDTITHGDAALSFLHTLIGEQRLVLGTDIPFDMGDPAPLDRVRRAGVDPEAIGVTAADLLRL